MRTHSLLATGLILLGLAGIGLALAVDGAQTAGERYVTFTFDDAYTSHPYAAERLEDRGWRGVFYVPVGLLGGTFEGIPTMSRDAVRTLDGAGHEIGGHTYTHENLSALNASAARTTLDQNRAALEALGVDPFSFAYPYGSVAHTDSVMERYTVARAGWGVNTLPVTDPARIRTVSLTEENAHILDDYIARLERGEWLVITLHHVDREEPVDRPQIDVSGETYTRILDLVANSSVTVSTMGDVPWNG